MVEKFEKTIPATRQKRRKAESKGQFPNSQELSISIALASLLLALAFLGEAFVHGLRSFLENSLSSLPREQLTQQDGIEIVRAGLSRVVAVTGPIAGVFVATAFCTSVYQTKGLSISMERFRIDFKKFDPIKGSKKILSKEGLVKLGIGLSKIACIFGVLFITIRPRIPEILLLGEKELSDIVSYTIHIFFLIIVRVTLLLFLLAFVDRRYQVHKTEEEMKMTKEEHKEEMKSSEGNPKVKRRILEQQRKILLQAMFDETEHADVVVTNPTHLAIALKYAPGEQGAPKVVAKGMNKVAEKIRKIARANKVPVIENKPLARALYQVCTVGMEIPEKLYRPVAELLAYVFKMRERRKAAARAARGMT